MDNFTIPALLQVERLHADPGLGDASAQRLCQCGCVTIRGSIHDHHGANICGLDLLHCPVAVQAQNPLSDAVLVITCD